MLGDVSKMLCIPALVALMPRPWGRCFCETLNVSVYLVLPEGSSMSAAAVQLVLIYWLRSSKGCRRQLSLQKLPCRPKDVPCKAYTAVRGMELRSLVIQIVIQMVAGADKAMRIILTYKVSKL